MAVGKSATHHANLDRAAEEVLDLFGTIGHEAVTTVERASPRVVAEDPEERSTVPDNLIEQPLPDTHAPVGLTHIDGVQLQRHVQPRLRRGTRARSPQ
jgi:hypothetical protein